MAALSDRPLRMLLHIAEGLNHRDGSADTRTAGRKSAGLVEVAVLHGSAMDARRNRGKSIGKQESVSAASKEGFDAQSGTGGDALLNRRLM